MRRPIDRAAMGRLALSIVETSLLFPVDRVQSLMKLVGCAIGRIDAADGATHQLHEALNAIDREEKTRLDD